MRIAAITEQGLYWITTLVVVLWGCIALENSVVKQSRWETAHVLVELRHMRNGQRPIPVIQPIHKNFGTGKPAVG